jgi:hypothetical protein
VDIVIEGVTGAVGRAVEQWLAATRVRPGAPLRWRAVSDGRWASDDTDAAPGAGTVVVRATPPDAWAPRPDAVTVAPSISWQHRSRADVPDAGWFGGIGTLLGDVALDRADAPRALHVAYGLLPQAGRAWRLLGPTTRTAALDAVLAGGPARVDGESTPEPFAVGRRLAWFPAPVGPAHAVAVPGHEVHALAGVPTVRTWVAAGSLRAEALQAFGRARPGGRLARLARRRAARPRSGTTEALRWAVVAEVRDGDDGVVRAWANGTDPTAATGGLLAVTAERIASGAAAGTDSVATVAPAGELLDTLADGGALRWSVAKPVPSSR